MRLVQQNKDNPKMLEVAWMWLPTFIGQNTALLRDLDLHLAKEFPPPVECSEEVLDEMHKSVIEFLEGKLGICNLSKYLKAIWWVGEEGFGDEKTAPVKEIPL